VAVVVRQLAVDPNVLHQPHPDLGIWLSREQANSGEYITLLHSLGAAEPRNVRFQTRLALRTAAGEELAGAAQVVITWCRVLGIVTNGTWQGAAVNSGQGAVVVFTMNWGDIADMDADKSFVTGIKRMYFHGSTQEPFTLDIQRVVAQVGHDAGRSPATPRDLLGWLGEDGRAKLRVPV
jgi:hypothetical protein